MSECVFGQCDGSGFLYDQGTNTAYDCRCRAQVIARNKAHSLSAVIPKLYRNISFDRSVNDVEPRYTVTATRDFVSRIDHHLDAGHGLWFMGEVGTGKTTLAMLVSRAALQQGRSVAIYSLPRLLTEIRHSFDTPGAHLTLLDRLTAVDLLHIDDIGAEQTTPWVLEVLYSIINARYEDQRSMVVTTNLTNPDVLAEQIGQRTVSRLREMCDELQLLNEDLRGGDRSWRSPAADEVRPDEFRHSFRT